MPYTTDPFFCRLRAREFARLDALGQTYLDYTGGALYPESLVSRHAETLRGGVFGNPHSDSPASRASTARVEEARAAVLRHFRADPAEYEVCFTANASGALRLVGEAFPFRPGARLLLAADNHNSVNGLREFARRAGADVRHLPLDGELRLLGAAEALDEPPASAPGLFALPAQSNFSGVRHPAGLAAAARERGWRVLLDAAAAAPSGGLRLGEGGPDFACVSFYKMFGYPTGVGALLARRDALAELRRPWFAGGTVEFVSTRHGTHLLRRGAEGFEDGTLDFLGIAAVPDGLEWLAGVGAERLAAHLGGLTAALLDGLRALRHPGGAPAVRIHGPATTESRGATVAFNLLDPAGRAVDHERVEARARRAGISVRGGCFCNPGAAEHAFGFPAEATRGFLERAAADGFSIPAFRAHLGGAAVGAVRVSLGPANVAEDVRRFLAFLDETRDEVAAEHAASPPADPHGRHGSNGGSGRAPGWRRGRASAP
ncbi:MAG: aminotransferase class V-fold PLP-dependent enzyme [Longimicrobiaceae bacterium]